MLGNQVERCVQSKVSALSSVRAKPFTECPPSDEHRKRGLGRLESNSCPEEDFLGSRFQLLPPRNPVVTSKET